MNAKGKTMLAELNEETHHNATLLGLDFVCGGEYGLCDDDFDNWLAGEIDEFIDNLQNEIKEKFGLDVELQQFGRGGATIATADWQTPNWGPSGYGEDVLRTRQDIVMLNYINARVDEEKRNLPDKWLAFCQVNGA